MGLRIKVVFDYECPLLEPRILTNPHMNQTGHIWFFQLAVCFWVLGLPLFFICFQGFVLVCLYAVGLPFAIRNSLGGTYHCGCIDRVAACIGE